MGNKLICIVIGFGGNYEPGREQCHLERISNCRRKSTSGIIGII